MLINDQRIKILGSYVDCLTMEETVQRVRSIIQSGETTQHVVINSSKINLMHQDKQLQEIINNVPLINADGQSIVWAGRFLGYDITERVAGIDLFVRLVELAALEGHRVYYFGATEEVVKKVVERHQAQYPELKIAGYQNGFFEEEESEKIVETINKSGADLLFVAFLSPKKEYWIDKHKKSLNVSFIMGVGGSFDVISGEKKRAPKWMQHTGLEWFFRFIQEPRRLFKRYIIGNLLFVGKVILEKYHLREFK